MECFIPILEKIDVLNVGKRRIIMMRLFNAREGMGKAEDVLPEKFFKPLKGGYTDSLTINKDEFEDALEEFYIQSKWDLQTGYPTKEALYDADLEYIYFFIRNFLNTYRFLEAFMV